MTMKLIMDDENGFISSDGDISDVEEQSKHSMSSATETTDRASAKELVGARSTQTTFLVTLLMTLLGLAASFSFIYLGVANATNDEKQQFEEQAILVEYEITAAWDDYEVAGLWMHHAIRGGNTSRREFKELYYHLLDTGLDIQAAEYVPNVTDAEREAYESESRAYYQENYPDLGITGSIKGFKSVEGADEMVIRASPKKPFYFPVRFVEPVDGNEPAINFDSYSSELRRTAIDAALTSWQPALSDRIRLPQERDESEAYSILFFHPGIPIADDPEVMPRDLALMLIRIPDLLQRSAKAAGIGGVAMYLYARNSFDEKDFMGAAEFNREREAGEELTMLPEIELDELIATYDGSLFFEDDFRVANRDWKVVAVPLEGEYEAEVAFIYLGGIIIGVVAVALSVWFFLHQRRKAEKVRHYFKKAETDKYIVSTLYPSNVRQRLFEQATYEKEKVDAGKKKSEVFKASNSPLTAESIFGSKPIADLCTS